MKYVNNDIISRIVSGAICITLAGGITGVIYKYDKKYQVTDIPYKIENIQPNELENIYKTFDIGKHKITISRNDIYYTSENIEGYVIESVKKDNAYIQNNLKITYVNIEPVTVKATKVKNGIVYFNDFGIPHKSKKLNKTR